jgi:hypothetical protein
MPNIEIHGLPQNGEGSAHDLRHKIFFAFQHEPYVDEMIITVIYDLVYMNGGRRVPFIRVVNSCQEHTGEIIEKLKQFDIDIEHAKLEAFYPTEERNNVYHDAAMKER